MNKAIILDFGAGDATMNHSEYVLGMMEKLPRDKNIIVKFQLFSKIQGLTSLNPMVFHEAWEYGKDRGIPVTASVFDDESLRFLLDYTIPFVKIACRPTQWSMISTIPLFVPVLVSIESMKNQASISSLNMDRNLSFMCCIPEYPAKRGTYTKRFPTWALDRGISDHTTDLELYKRHQPIIWERHYGKIGPDAEHAIEFEQLMEVIE